MLEVIIVLIVILFLIRDIFKGCVIPGAGCGCLVIIILGILFAIALEMVI